MTKQSLGQPAVLSLSLLSFLCAPATAQVSFTDVTSTYSMQTVYAGTHLGGGAAWTDLDEDGDWDLVVACGQGCAFILFRNQGGAGFTREAFLPSVASGEEAKTVVFCDLDEDGDPDMVCSSRPGRVRVLWGEPDGYREDPDWGWDVTQTSALYGVALADYDRDGDLDMYVGDHGGKNLLFRNDGGGQWVNRAAELEVTDSLGLAFQTVWFDYDNDGDQDIYVANDKAANTGHPNALFRNDGDGTFTDVSVESGANLVGELMGIGVGDYNNDGFLDFYTTNTPFPAGGLPGNLLGRNNGDGTFTEVASAAGVSTYEICWGANFFDADHDGDLDLFVAAMDLDDTNRLYLNNGDGTFSDGTIGSGLEDLDRSFGSTVADYDGDGDLDLYVTNSTGTSRLYRNDTATGNWLKIRLRGTDSNRDAIGARATAIDGQRLQIRELRAGISYLCMDAPELHFGFGGATMVDSLEIRWPSGQVQTLTDVPVNQTLTLVEPLTTELATALAGNVGTGEGAPVDVLFVNGSAGDAYRELTITRGDSFALQLDSPAAPAQARYVLYLGQALPRTSTLVALPSDLGSMVFATPLAGGMPFAILNTLGYENRLGASSRNVPPAPFVATRQSGISDGMNLVLQGLIEDPRSSSIHGLSITNTVVVHIR
jgi:hypothetical protein